MFKVRSIQLKITLWAGICMVFTAAIVIGYAAYSLYETALTSAEAEVTALAQKSAASIKAELEVPLDTARALAAALASARTAGEGLSRDEVSEMLRLVLVDNPSFLGVYTCWEPNAFDANDLAYTTTVGYDSSGRFIPYWSRDTHGEIMLEPLRDYETSDYYTLPRRTRQEQIIDPYPYVVQGEEVLMTSLVVPIVANGEFLGIAGVDVRLDDLQVLADEHKVGENGLLVVISYQGTLAAVSGQAALVGKYATALHADFDSDNELARIQQAQAISEYQDDELEAFVPIHFGRTATPWTVNAIMPQSEITAGATRLMWQMFGIGTGLVFAALVLLWLMARQISRPIEQMAAVANAIALGDVSQQVTLVQSDEVGQLADAFRAMSKSLRDKAEVARQFADGDMETEIDVLSEQDILGRAMVSMRASISGLVAEAGRLTQAAVDGKLSTRGDASKFRGGYREIVQGVNNTLDAVIGPLNVAAEYMERIAKGNIPQPISDTYHGDFNEIKNSLNTCIAAVNLLVADADLLARAGVEGKLSTRADATRHDGDFRRVVEGVNHTLDAVIGPLNIAAGFVDQIAQGVIPPPITDKYNGDFDALKNNLNRLSERLRAMLSEVGASAANLNAAAAEILAATTQQAAGSSEQSAAISQTTTTVDEVKTISEQASMRAQEVASSSQKTVEVARSGQRSVQETIESMAQIKERVESIAENILALSDQTQQIGEIIATVNEIASQSNMLALNASVEAARAGEHGKGFAVVAMEVRSLAEQSRQATSQVKAILSEIQKATNTTVMVTEEGTKGVDRGVQLAAQAREAIEQLASVINESAQIATQVVVSGQQQQTGIEQIALAMQNINQATVQSLASTRQAEKSAQSLNDLARKMSETVAQYRL
ncbi:MAG: methyl-accepting chemotaxis protein [Chloroflexota bacterium]